MGLVILLSSIRYENADFFFLFPPFIKMYFKAASRGCFLHRAIMAICYGSSRDANSFFAESVQAFINLICPLSSRAFR